VNEQSAYSMHTCAKISCTVLQVGSRIKTSVQQLGRSCIDLVRDAGNLQCNPSDAFAKRDLTDHAKKVLENVRFRAVLCGTTMVL